MVRRRHKLGRRRSGAVLVEAALVLPAVLLVFMGILEYARWLMTVNVCNNAVRAGAAYAAKHTSQIVLDGSTYGNATSNVTNAVNACLAGQQLQGQTISVYLSNSTGTNLGTWTSAGNGQYVCVQISGTYRFSVPRLLLLPSSISTSFKAVKRSEGN